MEIPDVIEDELESAAPEAEVDLATVLGQLHKRCEDAGLPFELTESEYGSAATIELSSGRSRRPIYVGSLKRAQDLLAVPFERQVLLGDFVARCCYEEDEIEAAITPVAPTSTWATLRRLYGRDLDLGRDASIPTLSASANDDGSGPTIAIGLISPTLLALARRLVVGLRPRQMSLTIRGAQIKHYDATLRLLTSVSSALFFDLDLRLGVSFQLVRDSDRLLVRRSRVGKTDADQVLTFPKYQYDSEPISLYWYARSASGMSLLQYLAFYQAIEFYFPLYSRAEAARRVRNLLKDPGFNANRDSDIGRLLSVVHAGAAKSFGDERSQLRVTLMECLDPDMLRQFLASDAERLKFLSSKNTNISQVRLNLDGVDDVRQQVAERIYDIRCRIVHTKANASDQDGKLLLPFSREAESMGHDIEVIAYVAQQVLVAGSSSLTI